VKNYPSFYTNSNGHRFGQQSIHTHIHIANITYIYITILYIIIITTTTICKRTVKGSGIDYLPLNYILMNPATIKQFIKMSPSNMCTEAYIRNSHPEFYDYYKLVELKRSQRPEEKVFYDKPYDTGFYTRRRTRPWDNCWFSNKPQYIIRTVEEVFRINPSYILWCYNNLNVKWSEYTIKMLQTNPNFKLKK
jgi:hypothetical protein